jgi:hypothetical protein
MPTNLESLPALPFQLRWEPSRSELADPSPRHRWLRRDPASVMALADVVDAWWPAAPCMVGHHRLRRCRRRDAAPVTRDGQALAVEREGLTFRPVTRTAWLGHDFHSGCRQTNEAWRCTAVVVLDGRFGPSRLVRIRGRNPPGRTSSHHTRRHGLRRLLDVMAGRYRSSRGTSASITSWTSARTIWSGDGKPIVGR